jgi:hypothetical protein
MMYGMNRILNIPLLLVIFVTVAFVATTAASAATKPVTVDYVIGLIDAGVDQADIVARIQERDLTFRFAPGDIDRLRAAGASEDLIDEVLGRNAVQENRPDATTGGTSGRQDKGGKDANGWGRPNRMGNGDATVPPVQGEAVYNGEGIEELPDDSDYSYSGSGYYYPGYSSYLFSYGYGYPYYYSPYYYPYYTYGFYSSPFCHIPRHSFRTAPRGGGSFQSAPRGGGGFRSAPHGGGNPRSAPRGSHHH